MLWRHLWWNDVLCEFFPTDINCITFKVDRQVNISTVRTHLLSYLLPNGCSKPINSSIKISLNLRLGRYIGRLYIFYIGYLYPLRKWLARCWNNIHSKQTLFKSITTQSVVVSTDTIPIWSNQNNCFFYYCSMCLTFVFNQMYYWCLYSNRYVVIFIIFKCTFTYRILVCWFIKICHHM